MGTTVDPNRYYEATIGAASAFTLSTIDFSLENLFGNSTFVLRSSADGFAADLGAGAFTEGDVTDFSVDVSSLGILNGRSEEHTSELQSLMRISYAVFCLK